MGPSLNAESHTNQLGWAHPLIAPQNQNGVTSNCGKKWLTWLVILEGYPALPLWEQFWLDLARNFIVLTRSEERGIDMALQAISNNVHDGGRSLKQFGLPEPLRRSPKVVIEQETYSSHSRELRDTAQNCFQRMNIEQKETFTSVILAATDYALAGRLNQKPFFLEGKPGRGKTFIVDSICCQLSLHTCRTTSHYNPWFNGFPIAPSS